MLKRIIFTGFFIGCSLVVAGQTNRELSVRDTITDKAIVFPADMEQNYDQLLSTWSRNVKYADNCRSLSDQAVIFEDSVYIRRLYTLPTKMELVFNPVVRSYIEMYAGRRRNQVSYMLGEGKYYFPLFEEALDREGLPLELKYLPVIESALNPIARSRVGATGLWQFMASTGKMYDLEINSLVDERRDPVKSTNAAARYLKDLYSIYGDWNLVIAAYNCGPGNVNKAIRRSGGQTDYWAIYPYLPRETRGYVPAFIAATYIMNYYNDHNICPLECRNPASMDSLMISKNVHFQQIADIINVSVDDLRQFNPQFSSDIIPGEYKQYALNLPIKKVSEFIDNSNTIYTHRFDQLMPHRKVAGLDVTGGGSSGSGTITHRVRRGDTLAKLAGRYGVTSKQIKNWNGLSSNKLTVGRRLKIYREVAQKSTGQSSATTLASNSSSGSNNVSASTKTEAKTITSYYKVRKGDTWAGIAKKNGATVAQIKKWNNIKSNKLIAGTSLKIQKTQYIQVQAEEMTQNKLSEPVLPTVEIDSTFTAALFDTYLKKVETERNESTLPRVHISSTDDENDHSTNDSRIIYHKVKIGETISQIANRYNVSKKDIQSWNKLSGNMAKVGQRLLIILPEGSDTLNSNSEQADRGTPYTADK
ncbi:LysM peptidoglycan-binding domain-containing protein [Dysgonomonas sp. 521]|nr:LysM peptidoglycan-binding domain-containing protein [Dysgonomonas sp. 521]NDV94997.1 LysM peptidoglycan-binding domain-containing protein [Dysgonomonas sp. 521]